MKVRPSNITVELFKSKSEFIPLSGRVEPRN